MGQVEVSGSGGSCASGPNFADVFIYLFIYLFTSLVTVLNFNYFLAMRWNSLCENWMKKHGTVLDIWCIDPFQSVPNPVPMPIILEDIVLEDLGDDDIALGPHLEVKTCDRFRLRPSSD